MLTRSRASACGAAARARPQSWVMRQEDPHRQARSRPCRHRRPAQVDALGQDARRRSRRGPGTGRSGYPLGRSAARAEATDPGGRGRDRGRAAPEHALRARQARRASGRTSCCTGPTTCSSASAAAWSARRPRAHSAEIRHHRRPGHANLDRLLGPVAGGRGGAPDGDHSRDPRCPRHAAARCRRACRVRRGEVARLAHRANETSRGLSGPGRAVTPDALVATAATRAAARLRPPAAGHHAPRLVPTRGPPCCGDSCGDAPAARDLAAAAARRHQGALGTQAGAPAAQAGLGLGHFEGRSRTGSPAGPMSALQASVPSVS